MQKKIIEEGFMQKTMIAVLLLACLGIPAFAQSGVITGMAGTVELKLAGADAFAQATLGETVALDTIISTGFKSTATITVGSATIIARPLTRLKLAEIAEAQGTETINVNLQAGRVRVDVKPPAGTKANFTVQSPHATASVRGTVLDVDSRSLWVREGSVHYEGRRGPSRVVYQNLSTWVDPAGGGKARNPYELAAGNLVPRPPTGVTGPQGGDGTAGAGSSPSGLLDSDGDSSGFGIGLNFQ
jgi:hypothetical protein